MAFIEKNLTSWPDSAYSRRARYHHATDDVAQVEAASYFNAAWAALPKGTIIDAVLLTGATPKLRNYVVTASSESGGVTIAAQNVA